MSQEQTQEQMKKAALRPSWKNYIPHYLIITAVIALMIFISVTFSPGAFWGNVNYFIGLAVLLVVLGKVMLIRFSERFTITDKEVSMERGILNKSSVEVRILQIRTIQVKQHIWQRIMNIGDLLIASAGTEGYEIVAHGIDAPYEMRDKIQDLMSARLKTTEPDKNDD